MKNLCTWENYPILRCDESHLDMLTEFYDKVTGYLAETVNYPKWTPGVYPGRESVSRAIAERTQYMCLRQGTPAGAFILNTDPQGNYDRGEWQKDLQSGEYMVIHALAVSPDLKKNGIGMHLTGYCIAKAKSEHFRAVRLDVVPDNIPARKLYEKAGFTFAGEKDLARGIEEIPLFALYEFNL